VEAAKTVDGIVIATCSSQRGGMGGMVRDTAINNADEVVAGYSITVLDSHACCFILIHMKLKQSLDPDSYETVTPPVSYVSVGFICFIYAR
jgi:hypothetical protein